MNNKTEDLTSQINILKNAMQFYANPENYKGEQLILKDGGNLANHTLNSLSELENYQQQIIDLQELLSNNLDDNLTNQIDILNKINSITNKYI